MVEEEAIELPVALDFLQEMGLVTEERSGISFWLAIRSDLHGATMVWHRIDKGR